MKTRKRWFTLGMVIGTSATFWAWIIIIGSGVQQGTITLNKEK